MSNTEVIERPVGEVAPAADTAKQPMNLMEFIQHAATDRNVDVDKLERLVALYERQKADAARIAYFDAMRALKLELPIIERNGRIVIHEKGKEKVDANIIQNTPFARWEDIDKAITPMLDKHGFSLTFRTGIAADGKVTVTAIANHRLGHFEETTVTLPHDSSGSKNPVQAVASALSYGKRYAATMLLNIRTKGEDDDGNSAGDDSALDEPISDEDFAWIESMLPRVNRTAEQFCKFLKVDSLKAITKRGMPGAREVLNEALNTIQRKQSKANA